jgi:hypothetical protein
MLDYAIATRGVAGHTERCALSDILPQQITGADGRQVGEPIHEALGLRSLAHAGCTDEDDPRCARQTLERHSSGVRSAEY